MALSFGTRAMGFFCFRGKEMRRSIQILAFGCWFLIGASGHAFAGKCTGSPNCTACKNCSKCAHCRSGGTCGVCAPSKHRETEAPNRVPGLLANPTTSPAQAIQKQTPDGMVVRVIDGDTIVVQHGGKPESVRLIGVDTPEAVDPRKPVQYYAKEATWFTTQIALNQQVRLEVQEKPSSRDSDGRLLAYAFRQTDGLFVNKEIIEKGFGFAYLKYPFDPQRMEAFRTAEREARESKRGLWAPVVDKYNEITVPKDELRAASWIKMGDNLAKTNLPAAKGWYEKVLREYPRSRQGNIARERLKMPAVEEMILPPLDGEVAMGLLPTVRVSPITRPDLPAPPTSPETEASGRRTEQRGSRTAQADIEKRQKAEFESTFRPSGRSYSSRSTPGAEVHVRGNTRRNGTYVAPHTGSTPEPR